MNSTNDLAFTNERSRIQRDSACATALHSDITDVIMKYGIEKSTAIEFATWFMIDVFHVKPRVAHTDISWLLEIDDEFVEVSDELWDLMYEPRVDDQ
jgi:hypothetical protein